MKKMIKSLTLAAIFMVSAGAMAGGFTRAIEESAIFEWITRAVLSIVNLWWTVVSSIFGFFWNNFFEIAVVVLLLAIVASRR